jgi:phage shock protein C
MEETMAQVNTVKRLYKSRTERMIDGVCGGVAEYFRLDPTLVRLAWVLLTLLGGSGIILYIVAMIVMPANPAITPPAAIPQTVRTSHSNSKFWGILLVGVGVVWLMSNLGLSFWHHWWGFSWDILLPVLLVLAGVAFLFGGRNSLSANAPPASNDGIADGIADQQQAAQTTGRGRLFRSRTDRKLFGVCGGLAEYLAIDPVIVRILFVVAAFASFGFMLLLYIVMAIVVPQDHVTTVAPT